MHNTATGTLVFEWTLSWPTPVLIYSPTALPKFSREISFYWSSIMPSGRQIAAQTAAQVDPETIVHVDLTKPRGPRGG